MSTHPLQAPEIALKANELRLTALDMVYSAGSGHLGGAFSCAEILATLYYRVMKLRPCDSEWAERDRFVLSKGHACACLYAALADRGFFPHSDLRYFRSLEGHLQGHPRRGTPGIEVSTGPLGLGASIAAGLALAGLRYKSFRVFALLSDGELDAGIVWEAALFAAHQNLRNLTYIVDCNGLQYTGSTKDVLSLHPLDMKWRAFGWEVISGVDGHDPEALIQALLGHSPSMKPRVVLANTIKGKGVSFMEDSLDWHGKAPSEDEYFRARSELLTSIRAHD